MPEYVTTLKERRDVAEGTMAFVFEKPEGFRFKPGQSVDVSQIDPPETDPEGSVRTFSIASAPAEAGLMVATRMRDTAFKRVWKTMAPGGRVRIEGPFGGFTLHKDTAKPAVFLAGGIGITPFRSMIVQAQHDNPERRLLLFYSNRRPEDAAFLEDLQAVSRKNPRFTLVGTMTGLEGARLKWAGETGHLNKDMLRRFVEDLAAPTWYIAGPPAMVSAMQAVLGDAGVDEDSVRVEEFAGY